MAEEKEYAVSGMLYTDPSELEPGELYIKLTHWRVLKRILFGWMDKELEVNLQVLRYQRSAAQNRYMWGVIVPTVMAFIKETTGEKKTKDEVYAYLNTHILGYELRTLEIMGKEVFVMEGKRFSQMNTKDFAEAVDKIITHFDALGCFIQLPQDKKNNLLTDFINDD